MTTTLTSPDHFETPDFAVRRSPSVERLATGQATSDGDGVELTRVPRERMAVRANAPDRDGVRALLIAGRPLNEPIAQYGPFVMNNDAEIFQAVEDSRAGRFATSPGR